MFVSIFKTCWRVFCRENVRNYFITGLLLFQLKGKKNEFAFIQNLVNYCVKVSVNNLRRKWIKKSFRKLVETIRTWIPLLPWKTFFFTVNKRTVNRWHLRNFFSILAWKYIFSLSFLFLSLSLSLSLFFASSFLCKSRAKTWLRESKLSDENDETWLAIASMRKYRS